METIANRASVPGSGVFWGRTMETGLPPVVSGVLVGRTVGLAWIGGSAEEALSGIGATRGIVAAVLEVNAVVPPTAALIWLLAEPGRAEPSVPPDVP